MFNVSNIQDFKILHGNIMHICDFYHVNSFEPNVWFTLNLIPSIKAHVNTTLRWFWSSMDRQVLDIKANRDIPNTKKFWNLCGYF